MGKLRPGSEKCQVTEQVSGRPGDLLLDALPTLIGALKWEKAEDSVPIPALGTGRVAQQGQPGPLCHPPVGTWAIC